MGKKIFTEKQVNVSAFLGGPIPPGILIYRNYLALGKEKQAYTTLALTLIFTLTFFYALFQVPQVIMNKIPTFIFTAFYGILAFIFYKSFMSKEVNEAFEAGTQKASNWAVAGITLIGLILNIGIIFVYAIDKPFYDGELMKVNGNELYYETESVKIEDVNKLAAQFKKNGFFGSEYGNIAKLELINEEYLITMVINEQIWSDEELINGLISMKWLMEVRFDRKVNLRLESISFSGKSKYKDL